MPLWFKLFFTIYVLVLIPVYWKNWGLANFLWLSDISLFLTLIALWSESRFLASTIAVMGLGLELFWNFGFFYRLATGKFIGGLTSYMFDDSKPLFLRGLSLFHVFLPIIILWMIYKLGYDSRGLAGAVVLVTLLFVFTFFFTDPKENINMVFGPGETSQYKIPKDLYLALLLIVVSLLIFLPTHIVLKKFF